MAESLDRIESLPDTHHPDRVNPADRSNEEKKDNGFSNALKEKMKEKLRKKALAKDELILDEDDDTEDEHDEGQSTEEEGEVVETDDSPDDEPMDHVDLKA